MRYVKYSIQLFKDYSDNTDYVVANIEGKGKYVGTMIEAGQVNDTFFCWLEGDEHIYVDDAKTPAFIGTGTEDYFNSTFYFILDEYNKIPTHTKYPIYYKYSQKTNMIINFMDYESLAYDAESRNNTFMRILSGDTIIKSSRT